MNNIILHETEPVFLYCTVRTLKSPKWQRAIFIFHFATLLDQRLVNRFYSHTYMHTCNVNGGAKRTKSDSENDSRKRN